MKKLLSFSLVALMVMVLAISCGRKSPSVTEEVAQQEVVDSTAVASADENKECTGNCEGCENKAAEEKTEGTAE